LNLAHEIIRGRKKVQAARKAYGEAMLAKREGKMPETMQRLMFETSSDATGERDSQIIP
jgi:hypothetical protein